MKKNNEAQKIVDQALQVYQQENLSLAAELFEQAAQLFETQGDQPTAAEMRNNLSVVLLKSGQPHAAYKAAAETDQVFMQIGDAQRQAMALGNQAAALECVGQISQALELYQQCADLLNENGDQELRAYALQSLSQLQLRSGKQFQAVATLNTALENKPRLSLREKMIHRLLKKAAKKIGG